MMEARLMWTHQNALERRGAVALARLGWHAFPVDDATRVRQRMPCPPSEPCDLSGDAILSQPSLSLPLLRFARRLLLSFHSALFLGVIFFSVSAALFMPQDLG